MRSKSQTTWEAAAKCATLAQEADDPQSVDQMPTDACQYFFLQRVWRKTLNRSRATVVCSAHTVRCSVRRSKTSRPRIQRYTKMGVFVCVRTLFVTLPSTTADSPPRPCDAMTMRSQPLSEAAAIMA